MLPVVLARSEVTSSEATSCLSTRARRTELAFRPRPKAEPLERIRHPLPSPSLVKRVAHKLGLEDVGHEIRGVLDGQRVAGETVVSGSYHTVFRGVSYVSPPIDLGLAVATKQPFLDDRPVLGVPGWRNVTGRVDEPSRWDALFASAELRDAVADASRDTLWLDDRRCEISGGTDEAWLESAIRRAARVTRAVSEAAARVPVAAALAAHRPFWREYAEVHGFAGTDTPLRMWGPVAGGGVALAMQRVGVLSYRLQVRLELTAPLGVGLWVRRESWTTKLLNLVVPDVVLGDEVFDRAFQIGSTRGQDVSRVLDGEVRAALVELAHRTSELRVDDAAIALESREPEPAPDEVAWVLERVRRLARRIVENATGTTASGTPYR